MIITGRLSAHTTNIVLGDNKAIIYYALCQDDETLVTWYTAVLILPTGPIIRAGADSAEAIGLVLDELKHLVERERQDDYQKLLEWNHAALGGKLKKGE